MANLTKVFFGKIDNNKLIKSQNYERGFWGFEKDYVKLNKPINWEHGVFQYFSNNDNEFWSTVTECFKKTKTENFIKVKNELIKIDNDFSILSDLIELITLNGGDIFDVKDDFDLENTSIEEEKGDSFQFINLKNHGMHKIEKDNSIWIFEVLKYGELSYNIKNNNLILCYKSSEDLKLIERFSFSILLKK
tara:strand:+ start:491 stop:1063 length:573 start_codon:yes stop_codon:yes gene_type:complete